MYFIAYQEHHKSIYYYARCSYILFYKKIYSKSVLGYLQLDIYFLSKYIYYIYQSTLIRMQQIGRYLMIQRTFVVFVRYAINCPFRKLIRLLGFESNFKGRIIQTRLSQMINMAAISNYINNSLFQYRKTIKCGLFIGNEKET